MNAIRVDGVFAVIPIFRVDTVTRLTNAGELETCQMVTCEIFDKHLRGQPLGRGQALCVEEDAPKFDALWGADMALQRALNSMTKVGLLGEAEASEIFDKFVVAARKMVGATRLRLVVIQ
jgi:hypothetical protein